MLPLEEAGIPVCPDIDGVVSSLVLPERHRGEDRPVCENVRCRWQTRRLLSSLETWGTWPCFRHDDNVHVRAQHSCPSAFRCKGRGAEISRPVTCKRSSSTARRPLLVQSWVEIRTG
jgi:hypothetical protein